MSTFFSNKGDWNVYDLTKFKIRLIKKILTLIQLNILPSDTSATLKYQQGHQHHRYDLKHAKFERPHPNGVQKKVNV